MSPTDDRLHLFDDAKFRAAIPFPLHPTNLPGAYTTPAPEDGFDPNTARPGDLVRAGLMWKRPDAASRPAFRTAWEQTMSRTWRRIVPTFDVRRGQTHRPQHPAGKETAGSTQTTTWWAGAANFAPPGNSLSTVIGFWQVPAVSIPPEPAGPDGGWASSSWIGIDGWLNSNDVLQAGIDQNVDAEGNAHYSAWYEWYVSPPSPGTVSGPVDSLGFPLAWVGPGGSFQYIYTTAITNFPVGASDQIYCSVQYINNNTAGHILIGNATTGAQFSLTLAPPPTASFDGQSVEWIMEAPVDAEGRRKSMPKFTQFQFTPAFACGANDTFTNPLLGDAIFYQSGGKTLVVASAWQDGVTVEFVG
jgi:Peptidase A4 family